MSQQPPLKRSRLNLNMGIANTHVVATQLIGIQLSGSNLLALAVSASSIVAGVVLLSIQFYPGQWPLWIVAGIIGAGLAVLIEGMTLGALIRIRIANKHIREIEEKLESVHTFNPGFHPIQAYFFWQKKRHATRLHRRSRNYSAPLAFVGAFASASAGGLFYHTILVGLGTWISLGLSALFALIVTGTFVSSEIFKEVQERAIKEGFAGGSITDAAIRQETKRLAILAVHDNIITYLGKPEAQEEVEKEAVNILHDIIQELRTTTVVTTVVSEPVTAAISGTTTVISEDQSQQLEQASVEPADQSPVGDTFHDFLVGLKPPVSMDEKLRKTLIFFQENGGEQSLIETKSWSEEDDQALADYLGLQKPGQARFWRLKAIDFIVKSLHVTDQNSSANNTRKQLAGTTPDTSVKAVQNVAGMSYDNGLCHNDPETDKFLQIVASRFVIVQRWRTESLVSVSVQEIQEATGYSPQKISANKNKMRSTRRKGTFLTLSVAKWLIESEQLHAAPQLLNTPAEPVVDNLEAEPLTDTESLAELDVEQTSDNSAEPITDRLVTDPELDAVFGVEQTSNSSDETVVPYTNGHKRLDDLSELLPDEFPTINNN